MFKLVLFVALCLIVLAKCQPMEERSEHRVARQAPGGDIAGQIGPMMDQMKQKFMEGMQKAMDFGKTLMAGMKPPGGQQGASPAA